jgi:hypothetical protein
MYKDILESIENLEIKDNYKKILLENCLEHIFSWNPCKVRNSEYYKRFEDLTKLKKNKGEKINPKKMLSEYFKKEISQDNSDNRISMLIDDFSNDDIKIVLTMKTLNSQVWHNRINAFWTTLISILSLIVSLVAIFIKVGTGN